MWDLYPDLASGVARLTWVGDGITWNEEFVLEELSYVVSEDPGLVRAVVNQEHRSYLLGLGPLATAPGTPPFLKAQVRRAGSGLPVVG